jgi:hypothetical protein
VRRSGGVSIDFAAQGWRGRGFVIALGDAAGGCC